MITDEIRVVEGTPEPVVTVSHRASCCIGLVTVWETGEMDGEVGDFRSGGAFLYAHYELVGEPDFDVTLREYMAALMHGPKD